MKKYSQIVTFLLVIVLLSLAAPSAGATGSARVGDQLYIRNSTASWPAGQPFYVAHGWWNPSNIPGVGLFKFSLDVDGSPVGVDFIERSAIPGDPDELVWYWVYNFPNGMTGTHTFTGHWTGPCQGLVDMDVIPGPCEKTNEIIESKTITIQVDFVP